MLKSRILIESNSRGFEKRAKHSRMPIKKIYIHTNTYR